MFELLDFYADWCGPCKIMKPAFAALEKEYDGRVVFKSVDVEAEGDLAAKYEIMSIPTLVLLKDQKEIDRKVGAMPKETMKGWIDSKL